MSSGAESYPLPDDPSLADMARAMRDDGSWGQLVDRDWNLVYVTDELRRTFGGGDPVDYAIGKPLFGPESMAAALRWPFGANSVELQRAGFELLGPFMLSDVADDRHRLRELVDPVFHDLIAGLEPSTAACVRGELGGRALTRATAVSTVVIRIRDETGRIVGTSTWAKPATGMDTISALTSNADLEYLDRMRVVARAMRRPAALLFADLEGSSMMSRRLSTASYFSFGRRLVREADRCVIEAGGLVGRHVGDGVVAFFLAETSGSESKAARACIEATRSLLASVGDVAEKSGIGADEVTLRFGLHWGSTVYVGSIATTGRSEVTALGDEVNEAARIEACATGGRTLVSKSLIERLDADDARVLGIDPDRIGYTVLGDLSTATDKARRDAPAIAVCEL